MACTASLSGHLPFWSTIPTAFWFCRKERDAGFSSALWGAKESLVLWSTSKATSTNSSACQTFQRTVTRKKIVVRRKGRLESGSVSLERVQFRAVQEIQERQKVSRLNALAPNTSSREIELEVQSAANQASAVSRVYIILVPLTLPNGLLSVAVDLTRVTFKQRMEHAITLVEGPDGKCVCFDFRPVDPEDPRVCFTLLTGRTSPGILRYSHLSRLPKKNCWLVGETTRSIEEAVEFHSKWDSNLHLIRNNCYTYTDALVEHLTGRPEALQTLQVGAPKRLVKVTPSKERGEL